MRAAFFIHGFASDRDDFARLVPLLTSYYDEIICPNLPAHGIGTEKEKLDHKKILEFTEKTIDTLLKRHKKVDVIGFSMGGALASYLAANKKIHRLVLLAPANIYLAPFFISKTVKWVFSATREKKNKKLGEVALSQNTLTVEELKKDSLYAARLFFGKMMKKINIKNYREFAHLVKNCNKCLKDITAPTLIIWGKLDQLVPYSSLKHVVGYCRNMLTRTLIWPDLSHLMLYSRLHFKITHEILRFLQDTDPPLLEFGKGTQNRL